MQIYKNPTLRSLTLAGMLACQSLFSAEPVEIKEVFFTTDQSRENIDSPAVWHGPNGEHLLFATSKAGHSVNVFDAVNGAMIQRVGGLGIELGQFNRPNGIWIIEDLMLVVERDNHRVQVLRIPEMQPLISFGEEELIKPYGLYVQPHSEGEYEVYVTDNYETVTGDTPPDSELGHRVQVYHLQREGRTAEAEWIRSFGETKGEGRLFVVESIYGDPGQDRLLIAEELEDDAKGRRVKIYNMAGQYSGQTMGAGIFQAQVEGIALYPTGVDSGFWIVTDQSRDTNLFHCFDRQSLQHLGTVKGERTLNTDGIWVTTEAMPRFPRGTFYACDNDRAISAFDMKEVLSALGLDNE
ncbi:hypothetical protein [Coraliomargarita parva]|uniref:hypothetical protein n=1 Tax=Coraliomargarita parva TaxID=3014050 RepID=UPI0022B5C21F|nr:hypothetical protein [Coraliomargarita parva]